MHFDENERNPLQVEQVQATTPGIRQVNDFMACKAAMAFLCLTMQACGGMQREGGEGEGRTGAGAVKREGRSETEGEFRRPKPHGSLRTTWHHDGLCTAVTTPELE